MGLTQQLDNGVVMGWPTPLLTRQFTDDEEFAARLARLILERESETANVQRAQVGAWRSGNDLFEWPYPEVVTLKERVTTMMRGMLQIYTGSQSVTGEARMQAWATICRSGDFTRVHTHPTMHLSGVYYASVGQPDDTRPDAGQIGFLDPRTGVEMTGAPGQPFGERLTFNPTVGMMLMYPSWLRHYAEPFFGTGERISVSFSLHVSQWETPANDSGTAPQTPTGETLQ